MNGCHWGLNPNIPEVKLGALPSQTQKQSLKEAQLGIKADNRLAYYFIYNGV
jgi:hypothetical protein